MTPVGNEVERQSLTPRFPLTNSKAHSGELVDSIKDDKWDNIKVRKH